MSDEGVRLLAKGALVLVLIVAGAAVRAFVGPSQKRGEVMLAGTLGGISAGVLAGVGIRQLLGAEVSAVSAVLGLMLGWCAAWRLGRRIAS